MDYTGHQLWLIWFAILIAAIVILFVSKLKFNDLFQRREDRRKMFFYTNKTLDSTEEGLERSIKVKKVKHDAE